MWKSESSVLDTPKSRNSMQDVKVNSEIMKTSGPLKLYEENGEVTKIWNQTEFKEVKNENVVAQSSYSYEDFSEPKAECFLTNEHFQLLQKQRDTNPDGRYEGLYYEDEVTANKVVKYAREMVNVDITEATNIMRGFQETLRNGKIWWNPKKKSLPSNHIPRKVYKTDSLGHESYMTTPLIEVTEELVILNDEPGMGKSTYMTFFEQHLRETVTSNRVIISVNLNEVQQELSSVTDNDSLANILINVAPYIVQKTLETSGVRLFVLLDGFDRVIPRYEVQVNKFLQVLNGPNIHGLVTTRNHMRVAVESAAVNSICLSLVPLNPGEQDKYMQARGCISREELTRCIFSEHLKHKLSNPMILSMVVDAQKCLELGEFATSLNAEDILGLYSSFINSKHTVNLVEDNSLDNIQENSKLSTNLPFYYHIAWNEIVRGNTNGICEIKELASSMFIESFKKVAQEPPSGPVSNELLSYGLVYKQNCNLYVFTQLCFAEYFYARLLLQRTTPQVVKDTLFGFIYRQNVLRNVEEILGNMSKTTTLGISVRWLFISQNFNTRCVTLVNFVSGSLFPIFAREVLLTFVNGYPTDLWNAFRILIHTSSRNAFTKMFQWMTENDTNIKWTRNHLFKLNGNLNTETNLRLSSPSTVRLILAVAIIFDYRPLLTESEVLNAFRACEKIKNFEFPDEFPETFEGLGFDCNGRAGKLWQRMSEEATFEEECTNCDITSDRYYMDQRLVYFPLNWEDKLVSIQIVPNDVTTNTKAIRKSSILGKHCFLESIRVQTDVVDKEKFQTKTSKLNAAKLSLPSLRDFVYFASIAYKEDSVHGSKEKFLPVGFKFLVSASNSKLCNGYYGVAYVNEEKRQIVLSHRGTNISWKPWITNIFSIKFKYYTPRVASAMTFAHVVSEFARKHGFELLFTGHSLGAWLAQVTCFTTMYLTVCKCSTHFVSQAVSSVCSNSRPFTAAFDSPGAYEFLLKLKRSSLFSQHENTTQEINVELLPCENYLFHQNIINIINFHVGTVFLLDLNPVVVRSGFLGLNTHSIQNVVELIKNYGEDVVKWRIVDYKMNYRDYKNERWKIPILEGNSFSKCFFNDAELDFLKQLYLEDSYKSGSFEGLEYCDEKNANIIRKMRCQVDGSQVMCKWKTRLRYIAQVKRTVRCIQQGVLWWNPYKQTLPANYLIRTAFSRNDGKVQENLIDVVKVEKFVLLSGPPGIGKSSATTKLEEDLRHSLDDIPRVIIRLNLNDVQHILEATEKFSLTSFLEKAFPCINSQVLSLIQEGQYPLYMLLDGLDEVCPIYADKMKKIVHAFISNENSPVGKFITVKLVLTTRLHLQEFIENEFAVTAYHLSPLTLAQKEAYLFKQVFSNYEDGKFRAAKVLEKLPGSALNFMSSPLMLYMYSEIIEGIKSDQEVDIYSMYARFFDMKHELQVVVKEKCSRALNTTIRRVENIFKENLPFYTFVAIKELLSSEQTRKLELSLLCEKCGSKWLQEPHGKKLEELRRYGTLEESVRFKHRSFAEFVFASALVSEETPQELKNAMFALGYEFGGSVQQFVAAHFRRRKTSSEFVNPRIISVGWTKWLETGNMSKFSGQDDDFFNEMFTNTFSSDYDLNSDPMLIKLLLSDDHGCFLRWLKFVDPDWARTNIFQIQGERMGVHEKMVPVLADILVTKKEEMVLSRILSDEEINNSLVSSPDFVQAFYNNDDSLQLLSQMDSYQDSCGRFEGIYYQDELCANTANAIRCQVSPSGSTCDWRSRLELIPKLQQILHCLNEGTLWWNPTKSPSLPHYYYHRKVFGSNNESECALIDTVGCEKFVLLVGEPGIGKSFALWNLENRLRESLNDNPRVIICLNLNNVKEYTRNICDQNFSSFFDALFPHIKSSDVLSKIQYGHYPFYVLLDGPNELRRSCQAKLESFLHALLSTKDCMFGKYCSLKVVLTARPNIQKNLETEFNVKSRFLLKLTLAEQTQFLLKRVDSICNNIDAKEVLYSLSESTRALLSCPHMLDIFAENFQDKKPVANAETDIFSLYSHFVNLKHNLVGDEKNLKNENEAATIFQDLLPFYGLIAVSDLLTPEQFQQILDLDADCEKKSFLVASAAKAQELSTYGLVDVIENGEKTNVRFKQRSFAEFVYATLLINYDTPRDIKNFMFAVGYKFGQNIEKFVSAVLRKRTCENLTRDQLIIVSDGWTKWLENSKLADFKSTMETFLPSILSNSIDYSLDPNVTELLLSDDEGLFVKWLASVDTYYARDKVFHLTKYEAVTERMIAVLVGICFSTQADIDLSRIITVEEVRNSFKLFPNALNGTHKWNERLRSYCKPYLLKQTLDRRVTDNSFSELLALLPFYNDPFLRMVVSDLELGQFYASILDKSKLISLIVNEDTRTTDVIGTHMNSIKKCWGEDFIPRNFLQFRFKFGDLRGQSLFGCDDKQIDVFSDYFWNRVTEETTQQPLIAVQLIAKNAVGCCNFSLFLKNLEARCCSVRSGFNRCKADLKNSASAGKDIDDNLVKTLFRQGDELGVWNELEELSCSLLPYFILYSNDRNRHAKIPVKQCTNSKNRTIFEASAQSLLVASLFPREGFEPGCYELVHKNICRLGVGKALQPLLKFLLEANQLQIRKLIFSACEEASGQILQVVDVQVRELPVWEIIVLLLESRGCGNNNEFSKKTWIELLKGIFKDAPCCKIRRLLAAVSELLPENMLGQILIDSSLLRSIVSGTGRFNTENYCRPSDSEKTLALMEIILFFSRVFGRGRNLYIPLNRIVKSIPVETVAAIERLIMSQEDGFSLLQAEQIVRNQFKSPFDWLAEISQSQLLYKRESEWELLVNSIHMRSNGFQNYSPASTTDHVYGEGWSPLLRVSARLLGREETLRAAARQIYGPHRTTLWELARDDMIDGELLTVAVELGSQDAVKHLAWPGALKWVNKDGKTARDVAIAKGESHVEIVKFLSAKIDATKAMKS